LAAAGRADQEDVRLAQLDAVVLGAAGTVAGGLRGLDPLVVVVDGDREGAVGVVLPDHVLIEELADLDRLGQLVQRAAMAALGELLLEDLVARIEALVADVDALTCDERLDLLLTLTAERTLQQVAALSDPRHAASSPSRSAPGLPSSSPH